MDLHWHDKRWYVGHQSLNHLAPNDTTELLPPLSANSEGNLQFLIPKRSRKLDSYATKATDIIQNIEKLNVWRTSEGWKMYGPYGPPLDTNLLRAVGKLPYIPQYIGPLLAHTSQLSQDILSSSQRLSTQTIDDDQDESDKLPADLMSQGEDQEDDTQDIDTNREETRSSTLRDARTENEPVTNIPSREQEAILHIHFQR